MKKSPTARLIRHNLGQMIHQTRYAERMQLEALKAALEAGHSVVHDEIVMFDPNTVAARSSADFEQLRDAMRAEAAKWSEKFDGVTTTAPVKPVSVEEVKAAMDKLRPYLEEKPCALWPSPLGVSVGRRLELTPQPDGTMLGKQVGPAVYDFMCGRCGKGWNVGEGHKCK